MSTPVHVPRVNNNDDEVKLVELKVELGAHVSAGQVQIGRASCRERVYSSV